MHGSIVISDFIEEHWSAALREAAGEATWSVLMGDTFSADPAAAEVAYFSGDLYPHRGREFFFPLLQATQLKWLHSFSAGVDHPIFHRFLDAGVRLTTSSGAAAAAIAETVMLYLLHLSRDLRRYEDAQRARRWEPHDVRELAGATLLLVGLGPIGLEVAARARAFGMNVVGATRRPRPHDFPVIPLEELDDALPHADYVVLALPLTPRTAGMFDARRLARIRHDAFFVNVARGELVDEPALIDALAGGRIGGAALDVFAEEPLPPASPLWSMPNVLITPHASGRSLAANDRATGIFLDNLGRYLRGEPLRNEILGPTAEHT